MTTSRVMLPQILQKEVADFHYFWNRMIMLPEGARLRALILAGGLSTRMGRDKSLLTLPDGQRMCSYLFNVLKEVIHDPSDVHVSVRDHAQAAGLSTALAREVSVLCDTDLGLEDIGPATGLLAASKFDSGTYWLVIACDYPLITVQELECLLSTYQEPITCFKNEQGFVEPLLGIWSAQSLRHLRENVGQGKTGPSRTFREIGGHAITPADERSLMNTNTPEEWEMAMDLLRQKREVRKAAQSFSRLRYQHT